MSKFDFPGTFAKKLGVLAFTTFVWGGACFCAASAFIPFVMN